MLKDRNATLEIGKIERHHWQLWWIAVLVILALTVTIIATHAPRLIGVPKDVSTQLKTYLSGLSFLVFLFCVYVLQNNYNLGKLRRQLLQKEMEKAGVQSLLEVQSLLLEEVKERSNELMKTKEELEKEISEHKRVKERLSYLAHYDGLTGLPNRVLFMDRLGQMLIRAPWHKRLVAVLFLDLDRFKVINDTLGHNVGDLLLKAISDRLNACVRGGDTVSRLGGDEFTLILADVAQEQDIFPIADKVLDALSKPYVVENHKLFITSSIGISLYPKDGEDAQTLLNNADAAMYRAKEQGKNNYQFYTPDMNAKTSGRLRMEADLRHALEQGELLLHYQPMVDLKIGQIVGTEALVRWQHPDLGMISPGKFIPLAEETGMIVPIGEWVLRTACAQNKAWQDAGLLPIRVAVNLSARQFQQRDLVKMVGRVIKETGLDPNYLELELTESILMQNVEATIAMLRELHEMGTRLSIDDFGTGYSSLNYLKCFPVNALKIDQSFVRGTATNPDDAAIVRAIIAMAHSLGLKVIAEGVEKADQLEFLRSLKCDGMQGFLFSRPLPVEEATGLLAKKENQFDLSNSPLSKAGGRLDKLGRGAILNNKNK